MLFLLIKYTQLHTSIIYNCFCNTASNNFNCVTSVLGCLDTINLFVFVFIYLLLFVVCRMNTRSVQRALNSILGPRPSNGEGKSYIYLNLNELLDSLSSYMTVFEITYYVTYSLGVLIQTSLYHLTQQPLQQ